VTVVDTLVVVAASSRATVDASPGVAHPDGFSPVSFSHGSF
jgi:hypothetical protein